MWHCRLIKIERISHCSPGWLYLCLPSIAQPVLLHGVVPFEMQNITLHLALLYFVSFSLWPVSQYVEIHLNNSYVYRFTLLGTTCQLWTAVLQCFECDWN